MKQLTILICLFIGTARHAQQPKAYEIVYYSAQINKQIFSLNYADGYFAASLIKLNQPSQKTIMFIPKSGTAEINGELIFSAKSGATIKLSAARERTTNPRTIKGTYHFKGKTLLLLFHKIG